MSRKMIDYQVENGKISTIDGYKVGGGDELTGNALMGITKDSDTITRTLDTDGKVKFDTKGGDENTLTIIDYPADGKLTDEQFNMIKANPGKYAIRKKTWDKRDEIFLSSAENNPKYKIIYMDSIVDVQGQNAIIHKNSIELNEKNKSLQTNNINQVIVADYQKLPQVPSDASTSNYILKLVNGTPTWVKEAA